MMPGPLMQFVVSCEHATAHVPQRYRAAFRGADAALRSHRGSDIGALALARELADELLVPCIAARASRLLVDANRSLHHRAVFSRWSWNLDEGERQRAVAEYWRPHREAVQAAVAGHVANGATVLHLSVHSFTPRWQGLVRPIDFAWLYDPKRARERRLIAAWRAQLAELCPWLRLRRNAPYRGDSDGLTTEMRRQFAAGSYLGIELEVNQRFPLGPARPWRELRAAICESLTRVELARA